MDNLPRFITSIVQLWNVHQLREDLYKQAMALDNAAPLRRICSHGYISSLLFKKEVQWVYDEIKCFLLDGDISKLKLKTSQRLFFSSEDRLSIVKKLHEQERSTISQYETILTDVDLSNDDTIILSDHLQKLKDIDFNLNRELINSYESPRSFQKIAMA